MRGPVRLLAIAGAMALEGPAQADADPASCLPGFYDGGQVEIGAELKLDADGRFNYALAYGALDETASGTWQFRDGRVHLTSDPLTPPGFEVRGEEASPDDAFRVALDVPDGLLRQYFDAELAFADGTTEIRQFDEEGFAIPASGENRIVSVQIRFPVYGVHSETYPLGAGAAKTLRLRFLPNDLGKVAFAGEPLALDGSRLLLDRHERHLRFRPVEGGCAQPEPD